MDSGPVAPHANGRLDITLWICDGGIWEVGMLAVFVDRVDSETINTFVQPESNGTVVYCFTGGFVVPVEIRLLLGVEV